jgi:hypothetical protein
MTLKTLGLPSSMPVPSKGCEKDKATETVFVSPCMIMLSDGVSIPKQAMAGWPANSKKPKTDPNKIILSKETGRIKGFSSKSLEVHALALNRGSI